MKIYFCDGCNESVPLVDVQSGRITTIKGKLFCSNCIPPGAAGQSTAAPTEARPARRSPLLAVLVLLLLGWTVWRDWPLLTDTTPLDVELEERDPLSDLELRVERLDARVLQLTADADQAERALTSQRADLEALRAADSDQVRAQERTADELDRLARNLAEMSKHIEKVQLNANRTEALAVRVDALSDSVAAHQALLSMGAVSSGDSVMTLDEVEPTAMVAAPRTTAVDPARVAEIDALRRQLLDPAPDLRFEAVDRVESGRLHELAPDLVGMLDDEDMFVRLHVMHALETLVYEEAVPALFDVLEDGHAAIRKAGAETLVSLTGYDPGFDHKGSGPERSRAIRAWRDWYEESR